MPASTDQLALLGLFEEADDAALQRTFGDKTFTAEEIFDLLERQVAYLLEHRRDWLLGKLYRLDVRERDIKAALNSSSDESTSALLVRLVMLRQAEKAATRKLFRPLPHEPDEELGDLSW